MEHAGVVYEPWSGFPVAVADALRKGRKIEAIRRYRVETGAGLKEAKDFIDSLDVE